MLRSTEGKEGSFPQASCGRARDPSCYFVTPSPSHITDDPSSQEYLLHIFAIRLTNIHRSQKHPQFLANSPCPTAYQNQTGVNLVRGCLCMKKNTGSWPPDTPFHLCEIHVAPPAPQSSPGTKFYAKGLKRWRCTPQGDCR